MDGCILPGFDTAPLNRLNGGINVPPGILVISDRAALGQRLAAICDFLGLSLNELGTDHDPGAVLSAHRPVAVVTEAEGQWRDGYNVMMEVAAYDRDLPVLLLTGHNEALIGAAEAIVEICNLSSVTISPDLPPPGELVDLLVRAGRHAGISRMLGL